MNPTTVEPTSILLPPPQPHRPSTSCDLHPNEHFSGFCPSCLYERLSVLDPNNSPSHILKPPSSALRAIFRPFASRKCNNNNNNNNNPSSSSGFFPELRRTKSFSSSKNNGDGLFSGFFEPKRKSCEVRARCTLCSLFNLGDDERNGNVDTSQHSFVGVRGEVFEEKEEEEIELTGDDKVVMDNIEEEEEEEGIVLEESNVGGIVAEERVTEPEIIEETEEGRKEGSLLEEEASSVKDPIDLDSQAKKSSGKDFKDIAGSFWSASSVFSNKWQKWRRKQKLKKQERAGRSEMLPVMKPTGHHFRETQSEVADYGFGRRSWDTDPRLSLDAARFSLDVTRMSLDDTKHSFEMPRASWDGHLIGRSSFQRMPTIDSLVEDSPPSVRVLRTDMQISVEMPESMNSTNEDEASPGRSAQTRDYYLGSSSRRRKSLDRSNSVRKAAAAIVAEMDELKTIKRTKVTPAMADHALQGTSRVMARDKDSLRDPIPNVNNSNSLWDGCSEMFDLAFRENGSVIGNGDQKGTASKKSRRWGKVWNIWAFLHWRTGGGHSKDIENDGKPIGFNRRVLRSNRSVSCRNSSYSFEVNGKKRRDELVLERNHSARHSPNKVDNRGMLRFYATPNGSRRGGFGGSVK